MPVDPRRRQKKLERRKAKQKAQRREIARRESRGFAGRLEQAAKSPVLHCCITASFWDKGLGQLLFSRQLSNGNVAFVVFLVDRFCLGVKDTFFNVAPRSSYDRDMYGKLAESDELVPLKPECARKLVEGAVQYALDLGLAAHADYRTAKLIFGDLRAEDCTEEFEYGQNGKPLFIAGPNDTPERCRMIVRTLEEHLGPDGYHYMLPVSGSTLVRELPDEDEWDDEDEEESDEEDDEDGPVERA